MISNKNGGLNVGDAIVVGNNDGRIRAMVNDLGQRIKTAGPSTPVEITGINDVRHKLGIALLYLVMKRACLIGESTRS